MTPITTPPDRKERWLFSYMLPDGSQTITATELNDDNIRLEFVDVPGNRSYAVGMPKMKKEEMAEDVWGQIFDILLETFNPNVVFEFHNIWEKDEVMAAITAALFLR